MLQDGCIVGGILKRKSHHLEIDSFFEGCGSRRRIPLSVRRRQKVDEVEAARLQQRHDWPRLLVFADESFRVRVVKTRECEQNPQLVPNC